jgi:hypothetical protein
MHRITMIYQRLAKVFLICSDEQIDPFADPALRIAMQKREQLLRDLDLLLGDLCREWGFCNRLSAADLVAAVNVLSDIDFAHAVLRAEKMDPESESKWARRIQGRFDARFGSSISLTD